MPSVKHKLPHSARELVTLLGGPAFLSTATGYPTGTISSWSNRGAIGDAYRDEIVALASRNAAQAELEGKHALAAMWRGVDHAYLSRISARREGAADARSGAARKRLAFAAS